MKKKDDRWVLIEVENGRGTAVNMGSYFWGDTYFLRRLNDKGSVQDVIDYYIYCDEMHWKGNIPEFFSVKLNGVSVSEQKVIAADPNKWELELRIDGWADHELIEEEVTMPFFDLFGIIKELGRGLLRIIVAIPDWLIQNPEWALVILFFLAFLSVLYGWVKEGCW